MNDDDEKENPSDKPAWELMTASLRDQRALAPDDLAPIPISLANPAGKIGIGGLLDFVPDGETLH